MKTVDSWLPTLPAGRQPAGRALLSWAEDPRAPRLCRVSGSAGTGKTYLVGWLATALASPSAPTTRLPALALSTAGLTGRGAVWSLARLLGVAARTAAELRAEAGRDDRPVLLLVRDLNRAAEPREVADLLAGLLDLPRIRMVAELAEGTVEAAAFASFPSPAVLDLDQPGWTDGARFTRWYGQLGARSPFEAETVLANPRLARLAARIPAGTDTSGGVAAAWWAALPPDLRPALRALAAAGRPLTRREWAGYAEPGTVGRAAEVLAADSATEDTWWLPAGPLRDAVTAGSTAADQAGLVRALAATVPRTADGGPDLPAAEPGHLGLILDHAVRSGSAAALLDDPRFLAHADPVAVTAAFAALPDSRFATVWNAAGPALVGAPSGAERAAVLRARLLGHDPAAAAALDGSGAWRAEWAVWSAASEPRLAAAALTRGPYAGYVLTVDEGGRLRAVASATGQLSEVAAHPAPTPLLSLAALPDGAVVALDPTGRTRLLAGSSLPEPVDPAALDGARPTALGGLAGSVGDSAGRVHCLPATAVEHLHDGPVTALDGVPLARSGRPLLVSGGQDGTVRAWRPGTTPMPAPVDRRSCPVAAVAVGRGPRGLLVAAAWTDGLVRVRLLDGDDVVDLRPGGPVRSVLIDDAGRVVVVLADGVIGVALGDLPSPPRDVSSVAGFYFSTEPPSVEEVVSVRGGPALPDAVREEARRRPGQWLFAVDPAFDATGSVPPHGIVGGWQIDHQGVVARFIANPAHRPAGDAAGPPRPPAERALRRLVAGEGSAQDLLAALLDAELQLCARTAGSTELFVSPGVSGRDAVDACTSAGLVPRHWPGTVVMTGRELAAVAAGLDLRLDPGSEAAVAFPVDHLVPGDGRGDER
ncbi:type VII secretion system-associated protein [Kitasatospora sp. NPDC057015]|uniref:type VII secretion system-associated protein n=1 Tax=Kitasatospora sp. NPDC057015 TaxID=3346001 RepID=UPI003640DEBC